MTTQPRLLITRKLTDNVERRALETYDVVNNPADKLWTAQELIKNCQGIDAILPCHTEIFNADLIAALPSSVKIVANHSVGVDHCDLDAFKSKGIVVTNTPDVLSDATTEIAFLLMLGAARRAVEGDRMVRAGQWDSWSPSFMVGAQVTGKRLGIIGMGRVGQVMAKRARGFDMDVHYYNRKRLPTDLEQGAIFHTTPESLMQVSDFLSIHCPATPETKGLINRKRLKLLPKGAVVVNTARGAIIDEEALLDALDKGHIYAAGLDVFVNEPGGNPKFSSHDNVFMLPHIGSATFDTRDAMGYRALDNIDAFFAGTEPLDKLV